MNRHTRTTRQTTNRWTRLTRSLARARAKQLDLALAGQILESAAMGAKARLIRAALQTGMSPSQHQSQSQLRVGRSQRVTPRFAAALSLSVGLAPALALAQPATPVRTAEVAQETVQEHRRVTGSLQAVSRAAIASQESGKVQRVYVDEGELVATGDLLVTIDARRLQAQLEEARAELANFEAVVAQRQAELAFAKLERDRIRRAYEQDAASESEISEADTLLGVREAQHEAARRVVDATARRVDLLEIRVRDMQVRAPFDARVVARHVEPGEWTEPGLPVVTLVSTGTIEARLEVPERYAPTVLTDPGALYIELASDGRSARSLEVRSVPDVDARARTFQVIATLDNSAGELAPGMAVHAWVPTSQETLALLVPKDAVIRNGREAYVFRVGGDEAPQADRTSVTVLFVWGDKLAIASPALSQGDRVVIEGNERLMPSAPLAVTALPASRRN